MSFLFRIVQLSADMRVVYRDGKPVAQIVRETSGRWTAASADGSWSSVFGRFRLAKEAVFLRYGSEEK
jgi:hypothetical protein